MKKHYNSLILSITVATSLIFVSCSKDATYYGNIDSEGAVVYSSPDYNAEETDTLKYGEIVEYTINSSSAFAKVRNIATGVEGYVDTMKINRAQYPLEIPELAESEQDEPVLLNIETGDTWEIVSGWAFWKVGEKVKALYCVAEVFADGRMRSHNIYYVGTSQPGYICLTEMVDFDEESGEKLETPIIIYEDIAGRAGVFEGGLCFTPEGQLGGQDTDAWE